MFLNPIYVFFATIYKQIEIFSITLKVKHQLYLKSALHSLFIPLATQTSLAMPFQFSSFLGAKKKEIK